MSSPGSSDDNVFHNPATPPDVSDELVQDLQNTLSRIGSALTDFDQAATGFDDTFETLAKDAREYRVLKRAALKEQLTKASGEIENRLVKQPSQVKRRIAQFEATSAEHLSVAGKTDKPLSGEYLIVQSLPNSATQSRASSAERRASSAGSRASSVGPASPVQSRTSSTTLSHIGSIFRSRTNSVQSLASLAALSRIGSAQSLASSANSSVKMPGEELTPRWIIFKNKMDHLQTNVLAKIHKVKRDMVVDLQLADLKPLQN